MQNYASTCYTLKGFTILELLISLTILSITFGIAVPTLRSTYHSLQVSAQINSLLGNIYYGRQFAVTHSTTATLCPKQDTGVCGKNWSNGIFIFEDKNENGAIDSNETILKETPSWLSKGNLRWSSFGPRYYLKFTPQGITDNQNGSFIYCPTGLDMKFARALVLNKMGRARVSVDTNNDGIRETSAGKNIKC